MVLKCFAMVIYLFIVLSREKDGAVITEISDNGTLILDDLTESDGGYYRCRASNDYSSQYSDRAKLTVKSKYLFLLLNKVPWMQCNLWCNRLD